MRSKPSIFYPEDQNGYETEDFRKAEYQKIREAAIETFPGASGEVEALCMLVRHLQSVIAGAKRRYLEGEDTK